MYRNVASFRKVSYEQFKKDYTKIFLPDSEQEIECAYSNVAIPKRATSFSAGYDFVSPYSFQLSPEGVEYGGKVPSRSDESGKVLPPRKSVVIPTGIRARIERGWFLMCAPRSGLGFRYNTKLFNTVGIIDSDYFDSENEGHIIIKMNASMPIDIKEGDRFIQGVFVPFGVCCDDDIEEKRYGGFGSTGN